jgi:uncharacterized protein (TIGR03437 family)
MKKLILLSCFGAGVVMAQVPPAPMIASVVNNYITTSSVLCPGLLATVYGSNFGTSSGSGNPNSVTVTVGGEPAFVVGATPTQVNVQLPFDISTGPTTLTVALGGITSAPFNVTISAVAPTLPTVASSTAGLFYNTKGTLISSTVLANPGDTLTLYATGLGATNPALVAGVAPTGLTPTVVTPTLSVGGANATVSFAGASGNPGLYQINFIVPATVQGTVPVILSISGQTANTVTLTLAGISAIVNGGSFINSGTITAGEIVSLYANGLGSKNEGNVFPGTTSQGVSVTFNGTPAPIFELIATANQINLVTPSDLGTSGPVQVQLTTGAGTGPNFTMTLDAAVPGILLIPDPTNPAATDAAAQFANTAWDVLPVATAKAYGFALNCTVSMANPAAACAQPAAPGDFLSVYTTGLGLATPNGDPNGMPLATGALPPADGSVLYETVATPTVLIGGVPVKLTYSGLTPGDAGLYQLVFQVPTGVPEGNAVPLTVTMPGSNTGAATLAIQSR